jgi:hypothetical protein
MPYGCGKYQKRLAMGVETLSVDVPSELKNLIGEAADRENISMNEYVARLIAKQFKRPELGNIPRKRPGRPRKVPA